VKIPAVAIISALNLW